MTISRRQLLTGAAATLAAVPLVPAARAQGLTKIKFTLPWIPHGGFTHYFVAKKQGLWEKRGLDVTIDRGFGSGEVCKTLGLGQYEFGEIDFGVMTNCTSKALDLVGLGLIQPKATMGIFALAKKGIRTPKDLEGRKVGFATGSGDFQLWPAFVKLTGIDDSKVQKVFMGPPALIKALIDEQIDAEGNFYVAMGSDNDYRVVRYDKSGGNYTEGLTLRGFRSPYDVEVSRDGTVWVSDSQALNIKRFDANGKLLRTMKAGTSSQIGIGLDPDCNLWMNDIAQRRIAKYSPSGRLLATAAAPDLIAQDVVVGPKGDVYTYDVGTHTVIRFAEDKSKPATANVPGTITVSGGTAKIAYTLSCVACPSVVNATATLTGPGISGKAAGLKLKAGARNTITMKMAKAASGKATFKIVLRTNGRPTTETKSVTVSAR